MGYNHQQCFKKYSMNKGGFVDAVAEKVSITKKEADAVPSAVLETII
jgi:nucleoid DNA-binding protein